jgi:ketosteroid isomerase-like protein
MTDAQAGEFAAEWIRNFNAKDVDAVLAHFAEDAEFTSPRALDVAGRPTLRSRSELADYWHAAAKSVTSIRFTLDHVINNEAARRLAIVYTSEING